jgi:carbonic anhydrase
MVTRQNIPTRPSFNRNNRGGKVLCDIMAGTPPSRRFWAPDSVTISNQEQPMKRIPGQEVSRRQLLRTGLTATAAAFLTGGFDLAFPSLAYAQSKLTPSQALSELMEGNKRFTSGKPTAHEQDLAILKQHTEEKQEPFAAVLSCADSRVPVELVFDQSIGHVFVTRVAGNVITPEIIGSLEYGAAVLGTKVILVMGHSNCGAVKATMQGKDVPGQISSLFPHIQPGVDQGGTDLAAATKANAQVQAKLLRESSTVISGLVKSGSVKVTSGYYDLGTGSVTLLED